MNTKICTIISKTEKFRSLEIELEIKDLHIGLDEIKQIALDEIKIHIPPHLEIISLDVLDDRVIKEIAAESVDEAKRIAEQLSPSDFHRLEKIITITAEKTTTAIYNGFSKNDAERWAETRKGKGEIIKIDLITKGSDGILGFGKAPGQYQITYRFPAIVKAEYILKTIQVHAMIGVSKEFCGKMEIPASNCDIREMESILINHPSSIFAKTSYDGTSPIHYAVQANRLDVLKLLLSYGADVNDPNSSTRFKGNHDPLTIAVHYGYLEVVKLLVENGAKTSGTVASSNPMFILAASTIGTDYGPHQPELVLPIAQYLIDHGADINQKTPNGSTPLSLAIESHRDELAELLKKNGATI